MAFFDRGNAYSDKGDNDRAIADYSEAIRLDPKHSPRPTQRRGLAYRDKGDYDRAIADYNEAIRLDPKLRHGLQQPRHAYQRQGRQRPRHRRLQRGDPARPEIRHGLQQPRHAWHDKGDYDRAIADFNEAIRLDPKYACAYNNRGIA